MDLTVLETRLKSKYKYMGGFAAGASQTDLRSAILSAAQIIRDSRHPFPWKYVTASLSTTSGTKGPYSPPTGFRGLAPETRINILGWGDVQPVYSIEDSTTRAWDVHYNEMEDKLYFRTDPGTNTITLGYLKEFDIDVDNISTTLAQFPNGTYPAFEKLVHSVLLDRDGTKKLSQALESEGRRAIDEHWSTYRRGMRRSKQRAPRGLNGAILDNIAAPRSLSPDSGYYTGSRRRRN